MAQKKKKQIDKDSPEYKIALGVVIFIACILGALVITLVYKLIDGIL